MQEMHKNQNLTSKNAKSLERREFLKASTKFAGAFALSAFVGDSLFAATNIQGAQNTIPQVTLNNGVKMPILGLGTLRIGNSKEVQKAVEDALEIGYRLFDTAQSYNTEEGIGFALKATGVKREEIFITTKLFKDNATESKVESSYDRSLKMLQTDYVDLFLIHQPINDTYGAWRAMSKLYREKRVRAIGVSNFYPYRLVDFVHNNAIKPAVNQVECHPFWRQEEALDLAKQLGVQLESFSPFAQGKEDIFKNPILAKIAQKHNKTIAQVILRWITQRGIVAIPKTSKKERMIENMRIFDFHLDKSDFDAIHTLPTKQLLNHHDTKTIQWLNERKVGSSRK